MIYSFLGFRSVVDVVCAAFFFFVLKQFFFLCSYPGFLAVVKANEQKIKNRKKASKVEGSMNEEREREMERKSRRES